MTPFFLNTFQRLLVNTLKPHFTEVLIKCGCYDYQFPYGGSSYQKQPLEKAISRNHPIQKVYGRFRNVHSQIIALKIF